MPIAQLQTVTWRSVPPASRPIVLTDRDLNIMWTLARDLYATTEHLRTAGFRSTSAIFNRLIVLEKGGWIRGAKTKLPPSRRVIVWALSPQGAKLLEEDDQDRWRTYFEGWRSPVDQSVNHKRSILHELRRNTWGHHMEQLCRDSGWETDWLPGSAGHVRAYPNGGAQRVELTPDAVFFVNFHYWLIEYERSWRVSTLQAKLHRYGQYYKYRLWDQSFMREPRLAFVLAPDSTQTNSLEQWIANFSDQLGQRAWFLTDQVVVDDTLIIPGIHWDPKTRGLIRDSWFYTNAPAPR